MASPSTTKCPYSSSESDVWNFVHDSLTGNNYEQWRQQMHNLIEKEKLVGFIDGTTKAPPKKDSESENYRSWKISDDLLQKWIRTTLAEDICKEVKRVRTAKGLWTKLEKWFSKPIIITPSSMASSSLSSRNSSSAIVEYPVSEFVKKSLSVSENNYSEWRQQMYSLIKSEGLVDLVSGAVEAPAKRSDEDKLQGWIRTTLSTDIPEHVVRSRTAKSMWTKLERIFGHYVPLHKAAIKGDWKMANKFIEQEPDIAIRAGITEDSETMLIVAVKSERRNKFVKELVERMSPEDLALGDTRKTTALHRAAGAGNMDAAELLVNKNPHLPNAQTYDKRIPLYFAAARGHRKMVLYLLSVTNPSTNHLSRLGSRSLSNANHLLPNSQNPKPMDDGKRKGIDDDRWNPTPFDGESGFRILHLLISSRLYDIALALLRDKPELAFFIPEKEKDLLNYHSLMAIAQKPSSFRSGASFNFFQNKIYWC
ncbi:hypothetical protein HYC85_000290 [Camellia sinensis]|uniref:Retrotransposon Copia-like N-terminal domain-containing protein n=1 Tax=Camellia sinensis TaxID=4442 RepID=A0A7J7I3F1_CAMSI|nr:hypothetical protein HYC85_000290 [Camellia sinensis]